MVEMIILAILLVVTLLFFGIVSWREKIFGCAFVCITLAVAAAGISSYLVYDDITSMQEYTVLEKVTITDNENVKVYYIIRDEEGNKYITTKNVTLKVGETIQLNGKEINEKCKLVKFEKEE